MLYAVEKTKKRGKCMDEGLLCQGNLGQFVKPIKDSDQKKKLPIMYLY